MSFVESDVSSVSELNSSDTGKLLELGNPVQSSCLESPVAEEPGGLQSMGHKESDTTETTVHACRCTNYFAWGYPKMAK